MLKSVGKSLLGCLTVVALALAFYGLCSGLGYIGTLVSDSAAASTDTLYAQGWDMICTGVPILFGVAAIVFILWCVFMLVHMMGDLTLWVWKRLCSKPKKANA